MQIQSQNNFFALLHNSKHVAIIDTTSTSTTILDHFHVPLPAVPAQVLLICIVGLPLCKMNAIHVCIGYAYPAIFKKSCLYPSNFKFQ